MTSAESLQLAECELLGIEKAHFAPLGDLVERVVGAGLGGKEFGVLFEQLSAGKA